LIERRVVLLTDDEDEAFVELQNRRGLAAGVDGEPRYRGWDMAEVQDMVDPPDTTHKFCVFQIEENK
jgi:hypothetical protein